MLEEFVSEISKIVSSKEQKNVKTGQTHPILRVEWGEFDRRGEFDQFYLFLLGSP